MISSSSEKTSSKNTAETASKLAGQQDQDPLFLPISPENPAGENLRYSPVYDQITQARTEEDASLPQGVWERKLKAADYKKVEELCYTALCTQTKDLQLVAWLMESWVALYGAEGLRRGMTMLEKYLNVFWPVTYPKLDDPLEPELRMSPLIWLNEKFPIKIASYLQILPKSAKVDEPLTLLAWHHAEEIEKQISQAEDKEAAKKTFQRSGTVFLSDYHSLLSAAPPKELLALQKIIDESTEVADKIDAFIKAQLPDFRFAFSKLKKLFKEYQTLLQPLLANVVEEEQTEKESKEKKGAKARQDSGDELSADLKSDEKENGGDKSENPPEGAVDVSPAPLETGAQAAPTAPSAFLADTSLSASISSRKEAYKLLQQVSDYLMKLEPHSPSPYLIRKAIAWGNMSLEQLFTEIVSEGGDLQQFMRWLGMRQTQEGHHESHHEIHQENTFNDAAVYDDVEE